MSSFFGEFNGSSRETAIAWLSKFLETAIKEDWYGLYPAINGVEPPYHALEYNEDILIWLSDKPIRFPRHHTEQAAKFIYHLLTEGAWK